AARLSLCVQHCDAHVDLQNSHDGGVAWTAERFWFCRLQPVCLVQDYGQRSTQLIVDTRAELSHRVAKRSTAPARNRHANTAAEYREERTSARAPQLTNRVEPNECAAMRAQETALLQALLQHLKRFTQKVTACAYPQLAVVSRGSDPVDLVQM